MAVPLSDLPLPSISLVLHSNTLYIPTHPSVINRDQDPYPMPQTPQVDGIDQHDLETLEYQHFSYVLRGRLPSKQKKQRWSVRIFRSNDSTSASDATPFLSMLVRRIVAGCAAQFLLVHGHD